MKIVYTRMIELYLSFNKDKKMPIGIKFMVLIFMH